MASGNYITYEQRERFRQLAISGDYTRDELADITGWSRTSVDRYFRRMGLVTRVEAKDALPRGYRDYEAPPRVKTDHLAHCLAVIRANHGCGFPVCDLPPQLRVAA